MIYSIVKTLSRSIISIKAQIPQNPERYIERIHVIVDRNPQPLAGVFHLTPAMGKADLAMRIRIDQYTPVRAIAVNDKPLMTAEVGSSLSADPALDFFFKAEKTGTIKAEVMDSKGMQWSQSFAVKGQI